MRVLVTGAHGQVARALAERAGRHKMIFAARPEFDLADKNSIFRVVEREKPDLIISAAAYTAVDQAEVEPDAARMINAEGPAALARAAAMAGSPIIHLSTDYVFSGIEARPWSELDPALPVSVYGRTKLEGERAVAAGASDYVILRTAWIYSPFGSNFVATMLNLARSRSELRVVDDQFGNPTNALDIAEGILAVGRNLLASRDQQLRGTFHMASSGEASWADLAEATFRASAAIGGPCATVVRIPTSDYPTRATRPQNSRLDCVKLHSVHGVALPSWRTSLPSTVARLIRTGGR